MLLGSKQENERVFQNKFYTKELCDLLKQKYTLLENELQLTKEELHRVTVELKDKVEENLTLRRQIRAAEITFETFQTGLTIDHEAWEHRLQYLDTTFMTLSDEKKSEWVRKLKLKIEKYNKNFAVRRAAHNSWMAYVNRILSLPE